jgi:hypothetical protein
MRENDQFDNLMRERFQSESFDFDEKHWLSAEKMILEKENKDRRNKIFGFILSLIFLLVIGWWLFQKIPVATHQEKSPVSEKEKEKKVLVESLKKNVPKLKNEEKDGFLWKDKKIKERYTVKQTSGKKGPADVSEQSKTSRFLFENIKEKTPMNLISEASYPVDIQKNIILVEELPYSSSVMELAALDTVSSNKILSDLVLNNAEPFTDKIRSQRFNYYLYAGIFAGKAFTNTIDDAGIGFNPLTGAAIEFRLSPRWGISGGVSYFEKNKVNSDKSFHSEYYAGEFGRRTEDIHKEVLKLHYIQLPLIWHYHFNKPENQLQMGLGFSHLLTSTSSVTTSSQVTGEPIVASTKKVLGYLNGFKRHDFTFLMGYSMPVNRRLQAVVNLHYGWLDITENDYFENNKIDQNIGIQAYLQYRF